MVWALQSKEKGTMHFPPSQESISTLQPCLLLMFIIFSFCVYNSYCSCKERGQSNLKHALSLTAKSQSPENSTLFANMFQHPIFKKTKPVFIYLPPLLYKQISYIHLILGYILQKYIKTGTGHSRNFIVKKFVS